MPASADERRAAAGEGGPTQPLHQATIPPMNIIAGGRGAQSCHAGGVALAERVIDPSVAFPPDSPDLFGLSAIKSL